MTFYSRQISNYHTDSSVTRLDQTVDEKKCLFHKQKHTGTIRIAACFSAFYYFAAKKCTDTNHSFSSSHIGHSWLDIALLEEALQSCTKVKVAGQQCTNIHNSKKKKNSPSVKDSKISSDGNIVACRSSGHNLSWAWHKPHHKKSVLSTWSYSSLAH